MFSDDDITQFSNLLSRHNIPQIAIQIVQDSIRDFSRVVRDGYIVSSELLRKEVNLKTISNQLTQLTKQLKELVKQAQTNEAALADLALLTSFQEKLDNLITKVTDGRKAVIDYGIFCGYEALNQSKKLNLSGGINNSNNYFAQLSRDIFEVILKNLSFYEKQKLRRICHRFRFFVDDARVTENAIVYPLIDQQVVFFIHHVDAKQENTTNAITVSRMRTIIAKDFAKVREHVIDVAAGEVLQVIAGQDGGRRIYVFATSLFVILLLALSMYFVSRIHNPVIKYPLLSVAALLTLASIVFAIAFSISENFRKMISDGYSNYKYGSFLPAVNNKSLSVSESHLEVESCKQVVVEENRGPALLLVPHV